MHGRTLPPTTHDKSRVVPPIRQITPKNKKSKKLKFIDKAKQGVYIGVFKGAEFKNGLYFVIRPLLHWFLAWFLSEVSSIRQIVVGWIFGNIRPCIFILVGYMVHLANLCSHVMAHVSFSIACISNTNNQIIFLQDPWILVFCIFKCSTFIINEFHWCTRNSFSIPALKKSDML